MDTALVNERGGLMRVTWPAIAVAAWAVCVGSFGAQRSTSQLAAAAVAERPGTQSTVAAPTASPLQITVEHAELGQKFLAYVGGGANISPPDTVGGGGGIPMISISNGASFLAGEISAVEGRAKILRVGFTVNNPTPKPISFKIGDLALVTGTGQRADFAAVGYVEKLCAMSEQDRKRVKEIVEAVPAKGLTRMCIAFMVSLPAPRQARLALGTSMSAPFAVTDTAAKPPGH